MQTCENFVRSLVVQLLLSFQDTLIPPPIEELYVRHKSGFKRPPIKDLTECLISMIGMFEHVYVLGDAFDECKEWNKLWHFLSRIARSACGSLHLLFTSRPEQHIQDAVMSLCISSFDLSHGKMDHDIGTFVSESMEHDPRFRRTSAEGKILISESLISRANGMYVFYS
jgi:hypothetical protein